MNPHHEFQQRNRIFTQKMCDDQHLVDLTQKWFERASIYEYSYHFTWLGRPIIQFPQDIIALQEIIWQVKPDLIIETGIAHGGGLIFYASMMELLGGNGQVLGIDIDIRAHNRVEIEKHPMFKRISMIQASSTAPEVIKQVEKYVQGKRCVMVCLDSNHSHDHVLKEMQLYSPFVHKGSYLVVLDTIVEDIPKIAVNRPWGKGNNPKTAVWEFLKTNDRFQADRDIEDKLLITVAPNGYLKCIKG